MEQPQVHEQEHPGPRKYVVIATILMGVTALEVGLFYLIPTADVAGDVEDRIHDYRLVVGKKAQSSQQP